MPNTFKPAGAAMAALVAGLKVMEPTPEERAYWAAKRKREAEPKKD